MRAFNVPAGQLVQAMEMACDDRTRPDSAGVILAETDKAEQLDLAEPTVQPVEAALGSANVHVGNGLRIGAGDGVNGNAEIEDSRSHR